LHLNTAGHRPAAMDYGEAYENLFRSKVFQSELVVKEFDR
jgi:hypothetical protein